MIRYDSVSSWLQWFHETYSQLAEWPDTADMQGTPEEIVKRLADNSISRLQNLDHDLAGQSANTVLFLGQSLKKFRYGCTQLPRTAEESFIERNNKVRPVTDWRLISDMKELLNQALPSDFDDTAINGRFGPGACAERLTPFERWGVCNDFSYDVRTMQFIRPGRWFDVGPARLCAVPKDFAKLRLITVEPAENTFGQQYVRSCLLKSIRSGVLKHTVMALREGTPQVDDAGWPTSVLSKYGKDGCLRSLVNEQLLHEQTNDAAAVQRRLALAGSISGRQAALDLKDASDAIAWETVQAVFPAWAVAYLERFRTSSFVDSRKVRRTLLMYAGMGNATTFVVETLYFWALLTALSRRTGDKTPVSVFGDDIMCGVRAANNPWFRAQVLNAGLVINDMKSGISELVPRFREACGLVAVKGRELGSIIRIKGYDITKPGDVRDLCVLQHKLELLSRGYTLDRKVDERIRDDKVYRAVLSKLSTQITQDLTPWGIPVIPELLAQDGLWLYNPDYPLDAELMKQQLCEHVTERRWNSRYQRTEWLITTVNPVVRYVRRDAFSPSEALGFYVGQLHSMRKCRKGRTLIPVPSKDEHVLTQRWVAECAGLTPHGDGTDTFDEEFDATFVTP